MTVAVTQGRLGVPSRQYDNRGGSKARCLMCFGCGIPGTQTHSQAGGQALRLVLSVQNSAMHSGKVNRTGEHVACGESRGIDMWCGWKG